MDREDLLERLRNGGWELVGIGQGDFRALRTFGRMTKFPGTLYTDLDQPTLPAYRALGALGGGKDSCGFICEQIFKGTALGIKRVWWDGHRDLVSSRVSRHETPQSLVRRRVDENEGIPVPLVCNDPIDWCLQRGRVLVNFWCLPVARSHRHANHC